MGPAALTDLDAASRRWVLGLRLVRTAVAALALIALVACGSGGGTPAPAPVPPRITSVTPTSGIPGVTLVTLEGTGFDLAKVRFASQDAPTFETADGLRIVVRVPVGAVTGPITVETPVGSHASGPFTVLPVPPPLPEVTGFAPAEGSPDGGPALPGTLVTVTGTGLTRVREVVFGTAAGVITGGDDATQVSARVPANAQTGRIRVVTAAGEAASTAEFTVRPLAPSPEPPEITGFTPAEGAPGTRVTLTGKGFYGASQANLGTQVAPGHEVLNDTLMVVTIPNGAVTGAFSVAAPGGSRASSTEFKVLPPVPQGVTGISLDTGGPGQLVRLSGTGFQDARQVNFGQVRATEVTVVSDNLLTAVVPAGATTGPISVVTGERVFESAPFTVTDGGTPHAGLPVVQGLAPDHAAVGRAVTVTGSGLGGVTRVAFAGLVATGLQRIDDSSFIVTVPPAAVSGTLAVVTPAGIARSGGFTVDLPPPPPEVASFSPDRGAPGSTVTLGGSGFTGATAVTFNGAAAPPPYAISADGTSLVVTVPAAAASGRVTVVAPGGTGASQRDFQVDPPPAPAATTVAPLQGRPGTPVTLSGTLLGQVAAVLFGTVEGVPTTVAADGSQLTVPVPAGAGAGVLALSLRTATGTVVPVPGPGFAVEPPPPPGITSFSPDHGIPGTEVVVLGAHFTGVTQVAFAGAALPAARYDLDDDGRLRVRIPDDALADGALAVTTAAGTDATLGNFTVLPSRLRTYQEPLVEVLQPIFGVRQLDFPVERRTAQYAYGFPKAPVLHAYHLSPPAGGHGEVAGRTLPTFTLNLKLPSTFFAALPASVRNQIAVLGIPQDQVDIFCVSQNYLYDGITPDYGVYSFRPQYWLDPDQPYSSPTGFGHAFNLGVGLFEQDDPAIGLAPPAGTAPGTVFFNDQVTVHTPQDPVTLALIPGEVVSSPNNLQLLGLPGPLAVDTAPPVTTSFWSLTQENDRAAATLHLLFNDPDQAALQLPANTANTFAELSAGISPASFSPQGQRALLKLAALARPLITQVTRIPLPGAGTDRLTVVGSGFSDASAITLGGAAPLSSLVNSDAVIVLEVATGTAGPLVVTTPIGGASDPWMVVP